MTDLEQKIYDNLKNREPRSVTSHKIAHFLKLHLKYGTKAKQIVGMTIGRMVKKGIDVNYKAIKWRLRRR